MRGAGANAGVQFDESVDDFLYPNELKDSKVVQIREKLGPFAYTEPKEDVELTDGQE